MGQHDVVVVGAGLAGLSAARALRAEGRDVVVVEARERVGGRTEHGRLDEGTTVELGGQWVGPTQEHIRGLVDELGLETFPTYNTGDNLLEMDGEHRLLGSGPDAVPPLGRLGTVDFAQAMWRFDRLASRVPLDAPWEAPAARRLDARTLESWISTNLATAAARHLFRLLVEAVFAAQASDLSLLHALFYAQSGTSWETLLGVEGGAQHERIVGGSARIAEAMAADLGDRVLLAAPVRRVESVADRMRVITRTGEVHEARRAIVALPPTLAGRLEYAPALPALRDQLTQRVPAGSVIKTFAVYEEPFWREDGLTGQAISERGPIGLTFDNSPPSGRPGILLGFAEGEDARRMHRLPAHERRRVVLDVFARHFGERARSAEQYLERDWMAEEFTRGCYGGHLAPGVWTGYGDQLRRPCGPIHWAGAETAARWNGYMDGAVRSGRRAAREVLAVID